MEYRLRPLLPRKQIGLSASVGVCQLACLSDADLCVLVGSGGDVCRGSLWEGARWDGGVGFTHSSEDCPS